VHRLRRLLKSGCSRRPKTGDSRSSPRPTYNPSIANPRDRWLGYHFRSTSSILPGIERAHLTKHTKWIRSRQAHASIANPRDRLPGYHFRSTSSILPGMSRVSIRETVIHPHSPSIYQRKPALPGLLGVNFFNQLCTSGYLWAYLIYLPPPPVAEWLLVHNQMGDTRSSHVHAHSSSSTRIRAQLGGEALELAFYLTSTSGFPPSFG
jgi:hypothetical protein